MSAWGVVCDSFGWGDVLVISILMLKGDLIRPRIRVRKGKVKPRLLAADYDWLAVVQALLEIFEQHVGKTRAALSGALRDFEGDRVDYAIIRGLASVLYSRATFNTDPPVLPSELRERMFGLGPVTSKVGVWQLQSREEVVRETAVHYNLSPADIENALFADLAEEQILQEVGDPIAPKAVIERYNLEVARGLLYWAKEMQLHVEDSYRELFKFIKLMGLMHTVYPAETGYDITLHGPISPFVSSTIRYGLQFARFMPALLLCDNWQMAAQVRPPGKQEFFEYELDDSTELVSYFKSSAGFASQIEASFAAEFEERYTRTDRTWALGYEDELIPLGDTVMIPDFSFTHQKNGRRAFLEIIGFWHPDYVRRKLAKVKEAAREDLILLVYESANVSAEKFAAVSAGEVLRFKNKPVLKDVIAAVERCAI